MRLLSLFILIFFTISTHSKTEDYYNISNYFSQVDLPFHHLNTIMNYCESNFKINEKVVNEIIEVDMQDSKKYHKIVSELFEGIVIKRLGKEALEAIKEYNFDALRITEENTKEVFDEEIKKIGLNDFCINRWLEMRDFVWAIYESTLIFIEFIKSIDPIYILKNKELLDKLLEDLKPE